ncbi:MAG: hypothetical protein M1833_006498 [Piccolia ochrophora]|nr:MAG: hypothetical protein M1833_006498 [Piccolia ochrophora]
MPYLPTSTEWFHQSSLLLQARRSTTRITTKYTIQRPSKAPSSSDTASKATTTIPTQSTPQTQVTQTPRATLTLKTYDPASGVCLKYRTDKAAEVGRLVASLARLGRGMVGLADREGEDLRMENAAEVVEGGEGGGIVGPTTAAATAKVTGGTQGKGEAKGGAGGKKKKKGKR